MFSPAQPFLYLLAYIAVLYIRPHEYMPALEGVPILPVLLILAFGFWLARQNKNFEASQHRILLTLTMLMSFSVALAGWMGGAVLVWAEFGPTLLLFYMVATAVDSLAKLRVIFLLLTVASCVMALHGIGQVSNEWVTGWTGAVMIDGRITYLGFLNDPNDLGMSMLMTLPMCLYLANRGGFLVRWAFRAAAGLIMYGVFLTNSRGAMLGTGSMLLMYGILRFGLWRAVIVVPLMAGPLIALAPSRIGEISAEEDSAAGRVEAWYEGFQMLRSHPLFGVGKGLFTEHHFLTAHNSYMLAVAELGLVGYFVWLSNIVLTVAMLWAMIRPKAPVPAGTVPTDLIGRPGGASGPLEPPVFDPHGQPASEPSQPAALGADRGLHGEDTWDDCQQAARALLYGMVAALVCAFFLSRSYVVILYLQIAFVVAVHQLMRSKWPTVPAVRFGQNWGKLLAGSMSSVVVLWIVTRVLL